MCRNFQREWKHRWAPFFLPSFSLAEDRHWWAPILTFSIHLVAPLALSWHSPVDPSCPTRTPHRCPSKEAPILPHPTGSLSQDQHPSKVIPSQGGRAIVMTWPHSQTTPGANPPTIMPASTTTGPLSHPGQGQPYPPVCLWQSWAHHNRRTHATHTGDTSLSASFWLERVRNWASRPHQTPM